LRIRDAADRINTFGNPWTVGRTLDALADTIETPGMSERVIERAGGAMLEIKPAVVAMRRMPDYVESVSTA